MYTLVKTSLSRPAVHTFHCAYLPLFSLVLPSQSPVASRHATSGRQAPPELNQIARLNHTSRSRTAVDAYRV